METASVGGGAYSVTEESMDLEQIARHRRHSINSIDGLQENTTGNKVPWGFVVDKEDGHVIDYADSQTTDVLMLVSEVERQILRVAACLSSFDVRLLQASTRSNVNIVNILANTLEKGIVESANKEYTFASESFQSLLYRTIPSSENSHQHLIIGRNLVRNLSQQELEENYYTVLRQFHLGSESITDQSERYSIAVLCLRATELAVHNGDFQSASLYVDFGVCLLRNNCWKDEYELSLALYNACAEIAYSDSKFERVKSLVQSVLENARCFRDTLRARASRIYVLSSQYKIPEAVEESLAVLAELGEPLPPNPKTRQVLFQFMATQRLLKGKTNEIILRMPCMTNSDKIAASQILNLAFPSTYRSRPLLFALIVLRLVRLTIRYGLSTVSAVGFGFYGSLLCSITGNIGEGDRFGELALALLDKFHAKEWIPRVYLGVFGHAGSYKLPLQEMYPHIEYAQKIAFETGDIEYATGAANIMCAYIQLSGDTLGLLENKALEFYHCDEFQNHDSLMMMMETILQFVHNLTGRNKDPLKLSGHILTSEADILSRARKADDEVASSSLHCYMLILAYVFKDYQGAASRTKGIDPLLAPPYLHPTLSSFITFYTLSLLAIYNNRQGLARRRILSTARRTIKRLKRFSCYTPENCLGKLYFLQAELAAVQGKYQHARCMYASAVGVLSEVNDKMMHAIACERSGLFLSSLGDEAASRRYFRKAYEGFIDWGATAKAEQLKKDMPLIVA